MLHFCVEAAIIRINEMNEEFQLSLSTDDETTYIMRKMYHASAVYTFSRKHSNDSIVFGS